MSEDNTGVAGVARYRLWNPTHEQQRERYGVAGIGGGWMDGRVGGRLGGGCILPCRSYIHAHPPVRTNPFSAYTNAVKPGLEHTAHEWTTTRASVCRGRLQQARVARPTKLHPPHPFVLLVPFLLPGGRLTERGAIIVVTETPLEN